MAEDAGYVPDGDPCPKAGHGGQPTVLIILPGAERPMSQCPECREDFLRWFADHLRPVQRVFITPPPKRRPTQESFEL